MCTFIFCYENGVKNSFEHITRVEYVRANNVIVSEQELLSHRFPTKHDLHLYSANSNFTVSGNNISYIEVKEED